MSRVNHKIEKNCTENRKAVLDFFFIVCNKILPFILKMVIDEERKFSLTNFNGKKTDSDHFTLLCKFKFSVFRNVEERVEMFNFKNRKCQEVFNQKSTSRMELKMCFE